jgi:hypothetical protein
MLTLLALCPRKHHIAFAAHASKESSMSHKSSKIPAFLFDLDGTLIDSVYRHVLAWREALERGGIWGLSSTESA